MQYLWYNGLEQPHKNTAAMLSASRGLADSLRRTNSMTHSTRTPSFPANLDDYAPWVAKHGLLAPYGDCQCGCGTNTSIAPKSNRNKGLRQNHPLRYCNGHSTRVVVDLAPWVKLYGLFYPYGECQCGCGLKTNISNHTDRRKDKYEGHSMRFLRGHHNSRLTLEDAFWCNVVRGEPDECWVWSGTLTQKGYGQFRHKNKTYIASRASWEIHNGPIPEGLNALHSCDHPPCVNPSHLFIGTDADNIHDMIAKGRQNFYGRRKE